MQAPSSPPYWAMPPPGHGGRDRPPSQLKLYLYSILILLALLLVFLYLPPLFSSAARLLRPAGLRRGWDFLNLSLVLFAIICGFLGRRQDADPSPRSTDAMTADKNKLYGNSPRNEVELPKWLRDYGDGIRTVEGAPSLSRRNSNSYPDLRQVADEVVDARPKFFDDIDVISRRRKPNAPHITEVIPVTAAPATVEQRKLPRHSADEGSKSRRQSSSDKEASATEGPSKEAEEEAAVADMRRRLWGDDADCVPRSNMRQRKEVAVVEAADNPRKLSKMRSSSSYPDLRDIDSLDSDRRQFKDEPEIRRRPHHRRRRSYGGEYVGESSTVVDRYAVTPTTKTARSPPPPPPPPPLPTILKAFRKKSRAVASKDIATTLSTFYGKKSVKKQSKITHYTDASLLQSSYTTPTPPPPPPPPPPPTVLSIFSTKKKKKSPPTSEKPPKKKSLLDNPHFAVDNQSYLSIAPQSPLVPIAPPPPPPFRVKEMKFKDVGGGFVRVGSGFGSDSDAGDVSDADAAVSAFWPSPSVDTKADTFIARTRAGFRMEKMNSIKEKQVQVGPTPGLHI